MLTAKEAFNMSRSASIKRSIENKKILKIGVEIFEKSENIKNILALIKSAAQTGHQRLIIDNSQWLLLTAIDNVSYHSAAVACLKDLGFKVAEMTERGTIISW